MQVLIPPDAHKRKGARAGLGQAAPTSRAEPCSPTRPVGGLYRKRPGMIEPVFADEKHNRRIDRFQRRGRAAVQSELLLINTTHNLLSFTATG